MSKFKKDVMTMVKPASTLLNRSSNDLMAQKMVREIKLFVTYYLFYKVYQRKQGIRNF